MRRRVGDVAAVEEDRAVRRLLHAGDGAQQRRLARAVRAEQGDDLALLDVEVDAEQRPARRRRSRRRRGRSASCCGLRARAASAASSAMPAARAARMSRSTPPAALITTKPPITRNGTKARIPSRRPSESDKATIAREGDDPDEREPADALEPERAGSAAGTTSEIRVTNAGREQCADETERDGRERSRATTTARTQDGEAARPARMIAAAEQREHAAGAVTQQSVGNRAARPAGRAARPTPPSVPR